jgi:glycosyltransferase involved in cell wall biosynthesis
MRLAFVTSHPIQYYAPLFRTLAQQLDLVVFFGHRATALEQANAGFGVEFEWDVGLLSGYAHEFLRNVATRPAIDRFSGCDTPEIGERFRKGRFDVVLVQGWYLKSFLQAALAAKRQRVPVLMRGDSHLESPRSALKRTAKSVIYPAVLRLFDAALFVGSRSREYWTHYGYPTSRLFFSPHCVDADWFAARATPRARAKLRAQLGIDSKTEVVLFAGKLVAFKRPVDVISAAARMRGEGRDVCVLVAGAGPLESEMSAAARIAGVPIHMLGFCNQSVMPQAYSAADVLILPSDGRETWGLVANEALACGLPIILSDAVGSAPDLAGDGRAGRVFPLGNVEALAYAIGQLLDNRPSLDAIAAKSATFSLERAADGILRAATQVVNRRSSHEHKQCFWNVKDR